MTNNMYANVKRGARSKGNLALWIGLAVCALLIAAFALSVGFAGRYQRNYWDYVGRLSNSTAYAYRNGTLQISVSGETRSLDKERAYQIYQLVSNAGEGRIQKALPSGDANLCTSSLYYDALLSAAMLGRELHKPARQLAAYERQAAALRKNIDRHFGGMVEGFDTYRYYTGNDRLRAWICIPLTVGIDERKEATVEALFSPKLWTENGLLTRSGDKTFWDRSTLYALRGVYASGETEKATGYLSYYSGVRLLGDHVPYAIEAWPEGSQRHLSAESGLYCRILTEGVFGIRPTGFRSFTLTPRLPAAWDRMNLRNVRAFGSAFDIEVRRAAKGMEVAVTQDGREVVRKRLRAGQSLGVTLK